MMATVAWMIRVVVAVLVRKAAKGVTLAMKDLSSGVVRGMSKSPKMMCTYKKRRCIFGQGGGSFTHICARGISHRHIREEA